MCVCMLVRVCARVNELDVANVYQCYQICECASATVSIDVCVRVLMCMRVYGAAYLFKSFLGHFEASEPVGSVVVQIEVVVHAHLHGETPS